MCGIARANAGPGITTEGMTAAQGASLKNSGGSGAPVVSPGS